MIRLTILLLLLLFAPVWAQPEEPLVSPVYGVAELLQAGGETASRAKQGGKTYLVLHAEFKDVTSAKNFSSPRITPFHRAGRFLDVFAEPVQESFTDLARADGLVWVDSAGPVTIPPPVEVKEVRARASSESIVRNGYAGLTGKGVVVAVLDSGVDIRHPDFIEGRNTSRPTSRFEYFWDTTGTLQSGGQKAPASYPDGASIGTVYTQAQLSAAVRGEAKLPLLDSNGHGTACAGIAAGNGNGSLSVYSGVAPKATLVGVRLGNRAVENSYLLGAVLSWLEEVAGDRPLVVTNSWGGHGTGHDGVTVMERQLDARYPAALKGRMLLFAAGNDGSDSLHATGRYGTDSSTTLQWSAPKGGKLSLYFDSGGAPAAVSQTLKEKKGYIHPLTGQTVYSYRLPPGDGELTVSARSGQGAFDAYVLGKDAAFKNSCVSYSHLVSSPGTAAHVLTVGSYDFNSLFRYKDKTLSLGVGPNFKAPMQIGGLSDYSSPGYSRLGRLKPDVTAPGQWHTAPAPLDQSVKVIRDSTGNYRLFNGTSAATPYVAGLVALLMEKDPGLSLERFRGLLREHATQDLKTGKVPNPKWGLGKLDKAAFKAIVENL